MQNKTQYHLLSKLFHWLMAFLFILLFVMGKIMHDMEFGDEYFKLSRSIHGQIGIFVGLLWIARLAWRFISPPPTHEGLKPLDKKLSHIVHILFYLLFPLIVLSGYLMSTASGNGMQFLFIHLPSILEGRSVREFSSEMHELFTTIMLVLAILHALAAIKHHYIDKDNVLKSMLRG